MMWAVFFLYAVFGTIAGLLQKRQNEINKQLKKIDAVISNSACRIEALERVKRVHNPDALPQQQQQHWHIIEIAHIARQGWLIIVLDGVQLRSYIGEPFEWRTHPRSEFVSPLEQVLLNDAFQRRNWIHNRVAQAAAYAKDTGAGLEGFAESMRKRKIPDLAHGD